MLTVNCTLYTIQCTGIWLLEKKNIETKKKSIEFSIVLAHGTEQCFQAAKLSNLLKFVPSLCRMPMAIKFEVRELNNDQTFFS